MKFWEGLEQVLEVKKDVFGVKYLNFGLKSKKV